MTVKQIRRLNVQNSQSLYDRLSEGVLTYAWSRSEVDETEREHPRLIVERDGNILTAINHATASLAYSFHNDLAFIDHFMPMFEELLPRLRRELHADTVRFRLAYAPSKPRVEPVLKRLSFSPGRPWLGFLLRRGTPLPTTPVARSVKFRGGSIDDLDDLIRLDRESFPDTPMPSSGFRRHIESGDRLLLATSGSETIAFAMYSLDGDAGYISTLAVAETHRGGGIGAGLTARVAKQLFADGATEIGLRTDEDNAPAIRLYRRLGFAQQGAGRDYDRPTDPKAIAAMQQASEGTLIRFGGWR